MNLNQNPTKDEFRQLLAGADDQAGHDVLWVDASGDVHLTLLDGSFDPAHFSSRYPDVRLRFEEYPRDHGCVGREAVGDAAHVDEVFGRLVEQWQAAATADAGEIIVC